LPDGLNHRIARAPWLGGLFLTAALAAGVFWIAYDNGSYGLTSRGSIAIVVLWALALAISVSVWPQLRVPAPALVAGGFLAALAAWTGLSTLWAASNEKAFNEFDRVVLYLAVFAVALVASPRASVRRWLSGLALGTTAVGLLALVSALFPKAFHESQQLAQIFPEAESRLSYPVGYWNGLATLIAFSLPLLLFFAVHGRTLLVRALAVAPLPALVATIYLTSSRGGSLASVLAVIVFLGCAGRRWTAAGVTLVAAAGSVGTVAVLVARSDLVDHPHTAPAAIGQGQSAALLIGLICLATSVAYALLSRVVPSPPHLRGAAAGLFAGLIVALVVAGVAVARPVHRFEEFKEPPRAAATSVQSHLFSGAGNGRWQWWQSAVDEFQSRPVIGRGAGSFEGWWARHGTLPFFVRDAHSLYVETLAELGIVGLVLLLGFLLSVGTAGVGRLLGVVGEERSAVAALLAAFFAFLFEAGIDWMWELTAVGIVMALVAGLLTGPATAWSAVPVAAAAKPSVLRRLRLVAMVLAMGLALAEAIPLLAQLEVRRSQDAAESGDLPQALTDARGARSLQPWAASPHLQIALVFEEAGDLPNALAAIRHALERDDSDWRLWLVAARLETKAGDIDAARTSLDRARDLNPRSPLFATS
jgi:tetratricopeptide (TPR) repeat protein